MVREAQRRKKGQSIIMIEYSTLLRWDSTQDGDACVEMLLGEESPRDVGIDYFSNGSRSRDERG